MAYVFLALAFIMNAAATILINVAAKNQINIAAFFEGKWSLSHLYAILAVLLFGGNLLCYLFALRNLQLSLAYPIMISMSFLIVALWAFFEAHESISWLQLLGYVGIVGGIVLVTSFAKS
jgi:multidrug transporter EmrE-like cation transporter